MLPRQLIQGLRQIMPLRAMSHVHDLDLTFMPLAQGLAQNPPQRRKPCTRSQ
ncbi:hypothetical protein D3C76_1763710 [compost metagenome]